MEEKKPSGKTQIKIDLDSHLIRNEKDFLFTQVDGEAVLMNTLTGNYFGLNETANLIWNIVPNSPKIPNLVDKLMEIYDVERSVCTKETATLVAQLMRNGILKIKK